MIVEIFGGSAGAGVRLLEADDLTRLHVLARDVGPDVVRRTLEGTGLGTLDSHEQALLRVAALRHLADRAGSVEWNADFQRMLAYAATKDWLSADGSQVSAHLKLSTG